LIAKIVLQNSQLKMDTLYKYIDCDIYEQAAAEVLAQPKDRNILLFTGFASEAKQEQDGPIGTYFLAKALYRLGYYPIIISDYYCKDYFDQAKQNFETLLVPLKGFGHHFMYHKIIETYDPVALIAVNQSARSADGNYRNMSGGIINNQIAPLDLFFETENRILTIGIGNDGNEIGMGKYADILKNDLGFKNPSNVVTGHCLIGSNSSWASYGLIAAIDRDLLPGEKDLENYCEYILSLRAKDNVTKNRDTSALGFYIKKSMVILEKLRETIRI